jgi:hypothetical protein
MSLLVAVPVKETLHPTLKARACELAGAVCAEARNRELFGDVTLGWHEDLLPPTPPPGAGRFWHQARARNDLLAAHLRPEHEWVLWVDADLVDYPADLPAQLYAASPGNIVAPLVLIEGTSDRPEGPAFYDTLGFIHGGQRTPARPPYWPGANGSSLVELESVGCIYLIPAWVLRSGVAYASPPVDKDVDHPSLWNTGHTDHWPVMQQARALGLEVVCYTGAAAYHAALPNWGEAWH